MQAPDEQAPVFSILDTRTLVAFRDELRKTVNMEADCVQVGPEALPRLNFEAGQRSIIREIENEIQRRKEESSVL